MYFRERPEPAAGYASLATGVVLVVDSHFKRHIALAKSHPHANVR
jgi:hypothetical protein